MAKLTKDYNLAALYPDIAKEWHPTKNGALTPKNMHTGSGEKIWWKCSKNHSWQKTIKNRTNR